jgi:hypothetical protein
MERLWKTIPGDKSRRIREKTENDFKLISRLWFILEVKQVHSQTFLI